MRHEAIDTAANTVAERAIELGASVHVPRIVCALAGDQWEWVEPLILTRLTGRSITVTVYDHD